MSKINRDFNLSKVIYSKLNTKVKYYLESDNINDIKELIKQDNIYFIGNASKILFAFDYKKIVVIKYIKSEIKLLNNFLIVDSGCSLSKLGNFCIQNNIKGFEKLMTIPGLLGGSIINNVSFLDQCISDFIYCIEVIDEEGNNIILFKDEITFKYRHMEVYLSKYFISKVVFLVQFETTENLLFSKSNALLYRREHQPNILSLGSTFKNTDKIKAYRLIELYIPFTEYQGFYINQKHRNFIEIKPDLDKLNLVKLIERIQQVLYNNIGIFLETEIIIVY